MRSGCAHKIIMEWDLLFPIGEDLIVICRKNYDPISKTEEDMNFALNCIIWAHCATQSNQSGNSHLLPSLWEGEPPDQAVIFCFVEGIVLSLKEVLKSAYVFAQWWT